MARDEAGTSLEERTREYLTRFPHRDTDMSKYGVCRDWLISVIQAEAERCAKLACGMCYTGNRRFQKPNDAQWFHMEDGVLEDCRANAILWAYELGGEATAVKDSTGA